MQNTVGPPITARDVFQEKMASDDPGTFFGVSDRSAWKTTLAARPEIDATPHWEIFEKSLRWDRMDPR